MWWWWPLAVPCCPWRLRSAHAFAALATVAYGYGSYLFHGDATTVMGNLLLGVAVALVVDGIAGLMGLGPMGSLLVFGGLVKAPQGAMAGLVVWACLAVGGVIPGPVRCAQTPAAEVAVVADLAEAAAACAAAAAAARGYRVRAR